MVVSGEGLSYQWFGPGGVALSDVAGKITGATTSTLQIFTAQLNNEGNYQVRVSNTGGSVVSDSANLTISKEFITSQPKMLWLISQGVRYCNC